MLISCVIEFPKLVEAALARYGDLFANQCQRRHFAEYLTGLFVADRKTVLGIHLWHYRDDGACCKILVTSRITWEVSRIVRVYLHRWTGTETFHRDGKQQLGLGDCQLRDVQGQTRHMYLVMLAYSLLMGELEQSRAKEWALHRL